MSNKKVNEYFALQKCIFLYIIHYWPSLPALCVVGYLRYGLGVIYGVFPLATLTAIVLETPHGIFAE